MYARIQQQVHDVATITGKLLDKKSTCMNKISYLRGLQLCYVTLRRAYEDIEDIYFHYLLKPQIKLTQPMVLSCIICMHMLIQQQHAPSLPV
jgi:hypothetical protein